MDVPEKILQQFPWEQVHGSFVQGIVSDTGRFQGYAFFLKHRDERSRSGLEAIDAKVIRQGLSEALHEGVKARNNLFVF
jgi:hypothetical protein